MEREPEASESVLDQLHKTVQVFYKGEVVRMSNEEFAALQARDEAHFQKKLDIEAKLAQATDTLEKGRLRRQLRAVNRRMDPLAG